MYFFKIKDAPLTLTAILETQRRIKRNRIRMHVVGFLVLNLFLGFMALLGPTEPLPVYLQYLNQSFIPILLFASLADLFYGFWHSSFEYLNIEKYRDIQAWRILDSKVDAYCKKIAVQHREMLLGEYRMLEQPYFSETARARDLEAKNAVLSTK